MKITETEKEQKRIFLPDNEEPLEITLRIPKNLHEKIKEQAEKQGLSQASFVRQALMKAMESNPATSKKIDELLASCTTEDTFEIENENGFLNLVSTSQLKGEIWTTKELDKVAPKLVQGYQGYFMSPDINDLISRFSKAMELTKPQKQYLDKKVAEIFRKQGYDIKDTAETEETEKPKKTRKPEITEIAEESED